MFINRQPAQVNQQASKGQEVSTGLSRAELLFDRRALGFLGNNSLIRLGESCFRLQQGQVLINGPQNSCMGSKVLGVRGTTYVLTTTPNNEYQLSVLAGEAVVSDEALPNNGDEEPDILSLYPRLNPVIGFGSSAWGSNAGGKSIGEAAGLILGDVSFFLPLKQAEGSRLTCYSTASPISTVSGEPVRNWDTSGSTPTTAASARCWWDTTAGIARPVSSQLAVGGQWDKGRWQLGINGGIPGVYQQPRLCHWPSGIPIIDLGEQSVTLCRLRFAWHRQQLRRGAPWRGGADRTTSQYRLWPIRRPAEQRRRRTDRLSLCSSGIVYQRPQHGSEGNNVSTALASQRRPIPNRATRSTGSGQDNTPEGSVRRAWWAIQSVI